MTIVQEYRNTCLIIISSCSRLCYGHTLPYIHNGTSNITLSATLTLSLELYIFDFPHEFIRAITCNNKMINSLIHVTITIIIIIITHTRTYTHTHTHIYIYIYIYIYICLLLQQTSPWVFSSGQSFFPYYE